MLRNHRRLTNGASFFDPYLQAPSLVLWRCNLQHDRIVLPIEAIQPTGPGVGTMEPTHHALAHINKARTIHDILQSACSIPRAIKENLVIVLLQAAFLLTASHLSVQSGSHCGS